MTFPLAAIANAEAGSSVRAKLNQLVAAGNAIINVKEHFGAIANGVNDDTAAIQAAVNWDTGPERGIIFFPPGDYRVTAPITYEYNGALSIHFMGCGALSRITGSFADFIFRRVSTNPTAGIRTFEKMNLINNSSSTASGCIQMTGTVVGAVRDCWLTGMIGVNLSPTHVDSIVLDALTIGCSQPGCPTGSRGVMTCGHTRIMGCDMAGFEEAIRAWGPSITIHGGRYEINKNAIVLGKDHNGGTFGQTGLSIQGVTFEANDRTIHVNAVAGGLIAGCSIQGTNGAPAGLSVDGIYVSGAQNLVVMANSLSGGFSNSCIRDGSVDGTVYINNNCTNDGTHKIQQLNMASQFIHNGTQTNPVWQPSCAYADRPTGKARDGMRLIFTDLNSSTIGAAAAGGGANRMMCEYNEPNTTWYIMRPAPAS